MSRVMRKILAIEKNSWKNLWKVRNILSIACNVSLDKMPKEVKKERRVLTREEQEKLNQESIDKYINSGSDVWCERCF